MLDRNRTHQSHEDKLKAHAKGYTCQHGHPEWDSFPARPAEPEQADDKQRAAEARQWDSSILFLLCPRPSLVLCFLEVCIPTEEHRKRAQRTSANCEEAKPLNTRREPVQVLINDRIGLEGHVECAVTEREVQTCGGDDQLEEEHADRSGQDTYGELPQVCTLELVRCDDVGLGVLLADSLGPPEEEYGAVGLGKENQGDHRHARVNETDPEAPAPAYFGRREAGNDRGKERAEDGCLNVFTVCQHKPSEPR